MRKSLLLILVLLQMAVAEIVILNDTEKDFYSLEYVAVSGDLDTNRLLVKGNGYVISGDDVKAYLFGPSQDFVIGEAEINGLSATVSYDSKGYFLVLPNKGPFAFNAVMSIRRLGQLQLKVPGPMNELAFDLQHGYAVGGNEYGLSDRLVTIQRSEKSAVLADTSLRYTFGQTRMFYYVISLKSFGSSLGKYSVRLPNGENVLQVMGALRHEQKGNLLELELSGSDATVTVSGTFASQTLSMPLREGTIQVLIESDAEKKIGITTDAKEVDISESPLPSSYPNARAFLAAPASTFAVSIKDLTLLPSLAASVSSAQNRIAITEKGSALGELSYRYSNTGVDYIEIDAPGTPLYASAGRGAVKLTKDDKFMLAFPKTTNGQLDFVYFASLDLPAIAGIIDVPLASTTLPVTEQSTTIYMADEYFILETLGGKGGSELPPLPYIIVFSLVFGGVGFLLKRRLPFAAAYLVAALGLWIFSWQLCLLGLVMTIGVLMKRWLQGKVWWRWVLIGAGGLLVFSIILAILVTLMGNMGNFSSSRSELSAAYDMVEIQEAHEPMKGMTTVGSGKGGITVDTRTGVLPVKLDLPMLSDPLVFRNHLVTVENPVKLRLIVITSKAVWLIYLISALAAVFAFRLWKRVDK